MVKDLLTPDYIFEASWEVCNKVEGYTPFCQRGPIPYRVSLEIEYSLSARMYGKEKKIHCSLNLTSCVPNGKNMHLKKITFQSG